MKICKKRVIILLTKFADIALTCYTMQTILMKKRPVLHQLASLCIAASVFFSGATIAQANTFMPPQQYNYPGLTFSDALTFTQPLSIPEPTAILSFAAQHKLMLSKNTNKKPLEAIVLTPTLSALETTNAPKQSTPTISQQQTKTDLETQVPTTTPEPTTPVATTPATNYTPAPQTNTGGLNADVLFSMVNNYRQSNGLPAFQQDAKTCSLAQQRAPAVAGEVASGNMHAGLKAMDLPYWNTENIISMNSEAAAFNWWINDPIHHAAIVSNNTYSCVACSGNSCAEEFTSYVAK